MKIIVWDTSSKTSSIAALQSVASGSLQLISEMNLQVDVSHSEQLLWGIHQVLQAACWKLEDLDFLGVGVGPGSFTGIRIGVTTARTLGHCLSKPVVAVSSLAALAYPVARHFISQMKLQTDTFMLVARYATQAEVFALCGTVDQILSKSWSIAVDPQQKMITEQLLKIESLEQLLKKLVLGQRWLGLGEIFHRLHKSLTENMISMNFWDSGIMGRFVGEIAFQAWEAGFSQDALQLNPRYLSVSHAERKYLNQVKG